MEILPEESGLTQSYARLRDGDKFSLKQKGLICCTSKQKQRDGWWLIYCSPSKTERNLMNGTLFKGIFLQKFVPQKSIAQTERESVANINKPHKYDHGTI